MDADYTDKKIALLILSREEEDDIRVFVGKLIKEVDEFFFINDGRGWRLRIEPGRLEVVPPDLKEILLGADYSIRLRISNLTDVPDKEMLPTGLTWID